MTQTTNFDNEMKALAQGVYKGNESFIPKDWIKVSERDNPKNGFHGKAFYKDGKVVISIRGTDEKVNDLIKEDFGHLAIQKLPNQYADAQKFYEQIRNDFPNQKIVFTGHSLGGSLAQLMANKTGCETVTFNAYGVRDILQGNVRNNLDNIRNYGNINDTIFNNNIDNQLGGTYVIKKNYDKDSITKETNGYIGGLDPYFHHKIEWMGDIKDAVEYKPDRLEGQVNMDIDFKDLDNNRVFTNEEIGQMSTDEFSRLEDFINQQYKLGNIMSKADADTKLKTGELIWVNSYTRDDGTQVS